MPPKRATRWLVLLGLGVSFLVAQPLVTQAAPPSPVTRAFTKPIEPQTGYFAQKICDPIPRPGVVAVKDLLLKTYGDRVIYIPRYGCTGLSEHHEGRALDWMINARKVDQKATADSFIAWLQKSDQYGNKIAMARRMGVMYIIWNNKIWRAYDPGRGWTEYKSCSSRPSTSNDTECHRDHVHISFTWDGAMAGTSFYTGQVLDSGAPCGAIDSAGVAAPVQKGQQFIPVTPVRVLDSLRGLGVASAKKCRLEFTSNTSAGQQMEIQVAGRGGVPTAGVSAVALSVRAKTNAPSSVYLWPSGGTRTPSVAMKVAAGGSTRSTLVVPLGLDGKISLATSLGAQWISADVLGYYQQYGGMLFNPTEPRRVVTNVSIPANATKTIKFGGLNGVPGDGSGAFVLTVSTSGATKSGTLRVYPAGAAESITDVVSYRANARISSSVITASRRDGTIVIKNVNTGSAVEVTIDINGWYGTSGLGHTGTQPKRILDTTTGLGASGRVTSGRSVTFAVANQLGIPVNAKAVALQVLALDPDTGTAARFKSTTAVASSGYQVSVPTAASMAQYVVAPVGANGKVSLTGLTGSSNFRADVVGWWSPVTTQYVVSSALSVPTVLVPAQPTITGQVRPLALTAGGSVALQELKAGKWVKVGTARIAPNGQFSVVVPVKTYGSHSYRVYKGASSCSPLGCTLKSFATKPLVLRAAQPYSVTMVPSRTSVRSGSKITFTGKVAPTLVGSQVKVQVLRLGLWKTLGLATVQSKGTYSYSVLVKKRGLRQFRAYKASNNCSLGFCELRPGKSAIVQVTVR